MKLTIDAKLEAETYDEFSKIIWGLRTRIWLKFPEASLLRAELGQLIDSLVELRDS